MSRDRVRVSGSLHLLQLALNAAWPVMFFRIRNKRVSLLTIALLDCALFMEILKLRREDPLAAALLMPYLCWSGFATALNAAVSDPTPEKPGRRLSRMLDGGPPRFSSRAKPTILRVADGPGPWSPPQG